MIGSDIVVTILGTKGSQVRISVNAPTELAVRAEECDDMGSEDMKQENNDAPAKPLITIRRKKTFGETQ